MQVDVDVRGTSRVAVIAADRVILNDVRDALDLMMEIQLQYDCRKIVLPKELVTEDFFRLASGLAGEILQKYVNYGIRLALVGDFSQYASKSLRDFIYESNQGDRVFFLATEEEALDALHACG